MLILNQAPKTTKAPARSQRTGKQQKKKTNENHGEPQTSLDHGQDFLDTVNATSTPDPQSITCQDVPGDKGFTAEGSVRAANIPDDGDGTVERPDDYSFGVEDYDADGLGLDGEGEGDGEVEDGVEDPELPEDGNVEGDADYGDLEEGDEHADGEGDQDAYDPQDDGDNVDLDDSDADAGTDADADADIDPDTDIDPDVDDDIDPDIDVDIDPDIDADIDPDIDPDIDVNVDTDGFDLGDADVGLDLGDTDFGLDMGDTDFGLGDLADSLGDSIDIDVGDAGGLLVDLLGSFF